MPGPDHTPPRLIGHRGYAAVLVDIVDSRHHKDRGALQVEVRQAAARVNDRVPCLDPLTATIGDELQATYAQLFLAVRAIVELRLELHGVAELRCGIGWGEITIHDAERSPFGQDGSAWWSAREALDEVAGSTPRSSYAARMGVRVAAIPASPGSLAAPAVSPKTSRALPEPTEASIDMQAAVQALLALFDRALATLDTTEARIVLADLAGTPTVETAERLGLTPSAVSQRRTRNNLRELVAALRLVHTAV